MNVFISYSREDEALAHLLSYILTQTGVRCLIDRQLPQAQPFDDNLKYMIKEADVVLVLLTKSSLSSAWVNQEVGFAEACGKLIWPVAMEEKLEPVGLIQTRGTYSLFDWSDPEHTIKSLVQTLQRELGGQEDTLEGSGADQVFTDRTQRTRFIANRLEKLSTNNEDHNQEKIKVRNQAAVSIFAFSNEENYTSIAGHSAEYLDALNSERSAMEGLLENDNIELRLLLWPVRTYNPDLMHLRFNNLLDWMRKNLKHPRVEFKCFKYSGKHRLIVPGHFALEGHKAGGTTGYKVTIVHYQKQSVKDAARSFDLVWERARGNKSDSIKQVEKMRTDFLESSQ